MAGQHLPPVPPPRLSQRIDRDYFGSRQAFLVVRISILAASHSYYQKVHSAGPILEVETLDIGARFARIVILSACSGLLYCVIETFTE